MGSKKPDSLRIYVACLASYNNGVLHGEWIDVEGKDEQDIQEEINAILRSSKEPDAEEYAIHDTEGFGDLVGEYTSLSTVVQHASMLSEHGEAWGAYCSHVGEQYATEEGFQDAYEGTAESERAYAESWAQDTGMLSDVPEILVSYFDWEAYARDLFINDFYFDADTGAVFRRG